MRWKPVPRLPRCVRCKQQGTLCLDCHGFLDEIERLQDLGDKEGAAKKRWDLAQFRHEAARTAKAGRKKRQRLAPWATDPKSRWGLGARSKRALTLLRELIENPAGLTARQLAPLAKVATSTVGPYLRVLARCGIAIGVEEDLTTYCGKGTKPLRYYLKNPIQIARRYGFLPPFATKGEEPPQPILPIHATRWSTYAPVAVALTILRTIAERPNGVATSEIIKAAGYDPSVITRHFQTLQGLGFDLVVFRNPRSQNKSELIWKFRRYEYRLRVAE